MPDDINCKICPKFPRCIKEVQEVMLFAKIHGITREDVLSSIANTRPDMTVRSIQYLMEKAEEDIQTKIAKYSV